MNNNRNNRPVSRTGAQMSSRNTQMQRRESSEVDRAKEYRVPIEIKGPGLTQQQKMYLTGAALLAVILVILLLTLGRCANTAVNVSDSDKAQQATYIGNWNDTVMITEVMTDNSLFAKCADGMYYDWIEIYNNTSAPIDMSGWYLSDDAGKPDKFLIEDYIIEAKSYQVIYMSRRGEKDESGALHTSFSLSSAGESVVLSDKNGNTVYAVKVPESLPNVSYGLLNGKFVWMSSPTPGEANNGLSAEDISDFDGSELNVVINEVMNSNRSVLYDCEGDYNDWIELYNPTEKDIDLGGCTLTDNELNLYKWTFPAESVIHAGEYKLIFCSGKDKTDADGIIHTGFRLGRDETSVAICTPNGRISDKLSYTAIPENTSIGRSNVSDSDAPVYYSIPTPGKPNDTPIAEFTEEQLKKIQGIFD